MLELYQKGMSEAAIAKQLGISQVAVSKDLNILRKQFEKKREDEFNVIFNENLHLVKSNVKELYTRLDNENKITPKDAAYVLDGVLSHIKEFNKMIGAYRGKADKDSRQPGPFIIINTTTPVPQVAEKSPYIEVRSEPEGLP